METDKALDLIGRVQMSRIPAAKERNRTKIVNIENNSWQTRVETMLEFCANVDTNWIDESSLNFLESLEPRLAAGRGVSEKQEKWLKDLWVRYSQQ